MISKEEILAKKNWSSEYPNFMCESEIHDAMDEFAMEQAIAYGVFVTNGLRKIVPLWIKGEEIDTPNLTYSAFLEFQKQ